MEAIIILLIILDITYNLDITHNIDRTQTQCRHPIQSIQVYILPILSRHHRHCLDNRQSRHHIV